MNITFISSIHAVDARQWDALWQTHTPANYPFTQFGFLAALEDSGSVDGQAKKGSGWITQHVIVKDRIENQDTLIAAMPLYIKMHSYGEYVFDWSWADAYVRSGLEYYPKLVNAIPFTPATGPRIALHHKLHAKQQQAVINTIFQFLREHITSHDWSGFHALFPNTVDVKLFSSQGFSCRHGYQFHWFNQNYGSFDHFLQSFASRKRKNLKKERKIAHAHGLTLRMYRADELTAQDWDDFYLLYQHTYLKRSGRTGYLGRDFFHRLAKALPTQVLLLGIRDASRLVAGALFLRDANTLYGRYWGSIKEYDQLHFEACYYQGIDYAIQQGLQRFDPGAQGEHKIQRGFTPIKTVSFHYLHHHAFREAIDNFLAQEAQHIDIYIEQCRQSLPFNIDQLPVRIDRLINE